MIPSKRKGHVPNRFQMILPAKKRMVANAKNAAKGTLHNSQRKRDMRNSSKASPIPCPGIHRSQNPNRKHNASAGGAKTKVVLFTIQNLSFTETSLQLLPDGGTSIVHR